MRYFFYFSSLDFGWKSPDFSLQSPSCKGRHAGHASEKPV
jgi:hypothetical protein